MRKNRVNTKIKIELRYDKEDSSVNFLIDNIHGCFQNRTNCFILFVNTYKNYKYAQYTTKALIFELRTHHEVNLCGNTDNPIWRPSIRNIHKTRRIPSPLTTPIINHMKTQHVILQKCNVVGLQQKEIDDVTPMRKLKQPLRYAMTNNSSNTRDCLITDFYILIQEGEALFNTNVV